MTLNATEEAEWLDQFGITKVPSYQYHYRGWRYSNLADAIAQARRDIALSPSSQGATRG